MPFETLTLEQLCERARQSFRNELPGTDAFLWPNNVNVSSKVMGGMTHLSLIWLAYIAKQRFVSQADGEFLDKHGFVYGMPRLPASYAQGEVTFTGAAGATIPAGIKMQRADGVAYTVTAPGVVSGGGSVTLKVTADMPGAKGNSLAGAAVTLTATAGGLATSGVVGANGIGLGADQEGDEAYRERILWRLRMPPHGGAAHDYVTWAKEVSSGVTRVFVDPLADGAGTVTVYFLMDDTYTNGVPQGADVSAVQDYINTVRPVTAVVTVSAPTPVTIDLTISNLSPDTTAVRDAIALELADMMRREGRVSTAAEPFTLYRSKLWQAISQATGEDHHALSVPAGDTALDPGEYPVLGTITYA